MAIEIAMKDILGLIVKFVSFLWDFMANFAVHILNLKENIVSLELAMDRLKFVYEDVKGRVEREERQLMKRTNEVAKWLGRVESMEEEVIVILQKVKEQEQKKFAVFLRCKVGKRVSKMINEVNQLRTEEGGFKVVAEFVRAIVNEKPTEKTVGLDLILGRVWGYIEDTDLRIIGLYGLVGVGKTMLLKKINNEFLNKSCGFDLVIWVFVSNQSGLEQIQEEILRQLQIPDVRWKHLCKERKAETIYVMLKVKKFVLLLDDIWKRLDLVELGVLNHDEPMQKGSKVVFTTRTLDICGQMEAQPKIKVECLPPEAALDLFRTKVGEDTLNSHPRISKLAEIMAEGCKGLPLALVYVGRAMAGRNTPEEWEQVISILRNSPSQFPSMNDVLSFLKLSLDGLDADLLNCCVLCCSLFLEDRNIRKEELVDLWIEKGLSNVLSKGEYIIGSLKLACLLETGESEEFVKMHPLLCDMFLQKCI